MSAPTMAGAATTAGLATERVSTREVREAAFRSLRVAGASAGEAAAAAVTVVESEIQGWDGLGALLHEIDTVPARVSAPACSSRDAVFIVDNPSRRGPLLLGRPVFDLAATQVTRAMSVRTFVRGLGYHRVLLCLALELAKRTLGTTVLAEVGSGGATMCAVACTSDGRILVPADLAEFDHDIPRPSRSGPSDLCGGLCLTDDLYAGTTTEQWHVISTPHERVRHHEDALRNGIHLPADAWASVHRASRRFLVAEREDNPTEQG